MVDPDRFVNEWERYLRAIRSAHGRAVALRVEDAKPLEDMCGHIVAQLPSMEVLDAACALSHRPEQTRQEHEAKVVELTLRGFTRK